MVFESVRVFACALQASVAIDKVYGTVAYRSYKNANTPRTICADFRGNDEAVKQAI
jgi:hypothetical protein